MSTTTPTSTAPTASGAVTLDDVARLRLAVVRLARRQRQRADTGLSLGLQSALAVVDTNGPLTLGELAAIERVAPPTVTRIVAKLEDAGLVERGGDPADGRRVVVAITPAGAQRLAESRERRNAWLSEQLDRLPAADRRRLLAAVGSMERLLDLDRGPDDL